MRSATNAHTASKVMIDLLASVAHERGDVSSAGALYREALAMAWTNSDRLCVRMALPGLAGLAVVEGDSARALRLAAAANSLEQTLMPSSLSALIA